LRSLYKFHWLSDIVAIWILQERFAAGTKDMLDRWFKNEPFPEQNYIVREGKLASQYL
jgi:hypothetical protein